MYEGDLISQLTFSLDIESDKIENINEKFYLDIKRPDQYEATYNDVEIKVFDNCLGVYFELPEDEKESKVLARVRERKRYHNGKLIGTSNYNPIINIAVYNVDTLIPPMGIQLNIQKMSQLKIYTARQTLADKITSCYIKSLDTGRQMIQYRWKADITILELELKGE